MPDTLELLYEKMHHSLVIFVCRRVPTCEDAEDIVQDVFLKIHHNLDNVREMDRLESWVYQIARNTVVDYYRKNRPEVALPDLLTEDLPPEPDAEESLVPAMRETVESLPAAYREALLLTEYQGLSQVEMATRLGISISGAKSRVQRARQKVKDMLLSCCHFEFDRRGKILEYRERCCSCDTCN